MTLFKKELSKLSDEARKIQMAYEDSDETEFKVDDITYTYVDYICEPAIARGIIKIASEINWKVERFPHTMFIYTPSSGVSAWIGYTNRHGTRSTKRVNLIAPGDFDIYGKSFGEAALAIADIMKNAETLFQKA